MEAPLRIHNQILAIILLVMLTGHSAHAQTYPTQQFDHVILHGPGSTGDVSDMSTTATGNGTQTQLMSAWFAGLNKEGASAGTFLFGAGDLINRYGASTPHVLDIRDGSAASPVTTRGPTVTISRTDAIPDETVCGSNPNGNTEVCSALNIIVSSGLAQKQISSGINVYVTQNGVGGYNAQAASFAAEVTGSGAYGYAEGIYSQARRSSSGATAWGAEFRVSNYGPSSCRVSDLTSHPNCAVIMLGNDSPATGRLNGGVGMMLENPYSTPFSEGIVFQQNTILNKSIWDGSNSTTSIQIDGTHTTAIQIAATAGVITAASLNFNHTLNIGGSGSNSNLGIAITNAQNASYGTQIDFYKQHGSGGLIQASDVMTSVNGQGFDGSTYLVAAQMAMRAAGTPAAGIVPGEIDFATATSAGVLTRALLIDNTQTINIGNAGTLKLVDPLGNLFANSLIVGQTRNPYYAKLEVMGNIAAGTDANSKGNFGGTYTTGAHYNFTYMGSTLFDGTNWITNHDTFYGNNTVAEVVTDSTGIKFLTQISTGNTTRTDAQATFDTYLRMRILPTGPIDIGKITDTGFGNPGAGLFRILVAAGTNAGSCKLVAYAGTSTTPVTIVDNVGAGC